MSLLQPMRTVAVTIKKKKISGNKRLKDYFVYIITNETEIKA